MKALIQFFIRDNFTLEENFESLVLQGREDFYGYGNEVDNFIRGNRGHNDIQGFEGNDTLLGDKGRDTIDGGIGDDSISGDQGFDLIYGREGNGQIDGGDGNDKIHAGEGDDTVAGDAGHDTLFGEAGNDFLIGFDGDDKIHGGEGDDTIWGHLTTIPCLASRVTTLWMGARAMTVYLVTLETMKSAVVTVQTTFRRVRESTRFGAEMAMTKSMPAAKTTKFSAVQAQITSMDQLAMIPCEGRRR